MGKMTDKKITQRYDGALKRKARKSGQPYREDGFINVLNNYGTHKDLMENYFFMPEPEVPDEVIERFYEGDGLFAKVIDMPAEEVVKNGFTLENISDEKVIDFYTEALDELDWEETAITAMKWTRLFGGALVVMLINDGRGIDEPVDWDNIRSIDDMVVYDRSVVQLDYEYRYSYETDDPFRMRENRLGTPEYFYVYSRYGSFTVHESRCLIFKNGTLPENATNSIYQFWGMPEYHKVYRAIRNVELAQNSAPKMLDKSVQPVYSMKNLMEELATEGGEDRLLKRLETIDTSRNVMNTIAIDAEGEDFSFRQFTFTGVADTINSSASMLSAVSNIPQVMLFGNPISGMSSTDNTAMENYYNYIQRYQKKTLRSNLRYLLSIIFQAGVQTGEIEKIPNIRVEFNPLWSLDDFQQADLDLKKAQAEQIKAGTALQYMQAQVIDPSEIRRSLAESSDFDIETMMDNYTEEELEEFMPKQQEGGDDPMAAMMGMMGGGAPDGGEDGKPDIGGNAPAAAPAATKLPQDMSDEEKATAEETEAELNTKSTQPQNAQELRQKMVKGKSDSETIEERVRKAFEATGKSSKDSIAERMETAFKVLEEAHRGDSREDGGEGSGISDSRMDEDDGKWVTTEDGHKIHFNDEGVADKGNPFVVAAANGFGKLIKAGDEWGKSLSKDERRYIRLITGGTVNSTSAAEKMNKDLRTKGYMTTDGARKCFEHAKAAIDRFEVEEPMTVIRWGSPSLLGKRDLSLDEMKEREGITVGDPGFMSASIQLYGFEINPVMYEIKVPKGKGIGAYVDSVSINKGEKEFLFNAWSTFKVEKVEEIDYQYEVDREAGINETTKKVKVTMTWQPERLKEYWGGDYYRWFIEKQLEEKNK